MTIKEYVEIVSKRLQSGISREHSYRGDLETLIRDLVQGIEITNEPANVTDCGNPDYVITKGKIPVGYIEAKDIGKDLNSKSYKLVLRQELQEQVRELLGLQRSQIIQKQLQQTF